MEKKLLVVESEDSSFRHGLSILISSLSGAEIIYRYNVPTEVDGIAACMIHSPSLKDDVQAILDIKKFNIPLVVLTSAAYREDDAASKSQIEQFGILTIEKSIGMSCYRQALKLLNGEFDN